MPSIGTDSGGIQDAIINNETGIICEPENQEDTTKNLRKILSDNQLRKQMGIKGRKRAENLFTWKNKIKEYLNVINKN